MAGLGLLFFFLKKETFFIYINEKRYYYNTKQNATTEPAIKWQFISYNNLHE